MKFVNRGLANWFGIDPSARPCRRKRILRLGCSASTNNDNGLCAYQAAQTGTFGNSAVGSERTPGFQQYDASVRKDFTIWHEQKIGFGTDASNVFNQSELSNPTNSITSSTFGAITGVRLSA